MILNTSIFNPLHICMSILFHSSYKNKKFHIGYVALTVYLFDTMQNANRNTLKILI